MYSLTSQSTLYSARSAIDSAIRGISTAAALLAICGLALSACNQRTVTDVDPDTSIEARTDIPLDRNRDFDILFVIDNSRSMVEEQPSLAANFERIIAALDSPETGLPSIHIGVVTTDVGAGAACPGSGDDGRMINVGDSCVGPSDSFISDVVAEDGTRTRNYDGTLAEAFSCIAQVGTGGCGFEQPLESMYRALNKNPHNTGFLREHAYLAVIFVTDEDDCSTFDPQMFDPEYVDLSSPLGPYESFRCFDFGVTCDAGDLRAPGAKTSCAPDEDSPYMYGVDRYIDFLYDLKDSSSQIVVASIAGAPEPVEVEVLLDPSPGGNTPVDIAQLVPSCASANGEAVPPIRLNAFLDGFPSRSRRTEICGEDLSPAVEQIARFIGEQFTSCVRGDLLDIDPSTPELDRDCVVSELQFAGTEHEVERPLSECDNLADPVSSSTLPCYTMLADVACIEEPTGLALEVYYPDGFTVPPSTRAVARCQGRASR